MRAKQYLCFNNNIISGEDLKRVKCIYPPPPPLVAKANVCSKATARLSLIHCFVFPPLLAVVQCLVMILLCITSCLFKFCNHLDEEVRAGCFTFILWFLFTASWVDLQCVIFFF